MNEELYQCSGNESPEGANLSSTLQLIRRVSAITITIPAGVLFCGNRQAHSKFMANSSLKEQTILEEMVYNVFEKVKRLFFYFQNTNCGAMYHPST